MNETGANGSHAEIGTLDADDVRERLWAYEDFTAAEEHAPFDMAGAFASLGFVRAAVRRRRRFWVLWAVIGMVVGLGIFVKYPVSYQATVTLIVKNNPQDDPVSAMQSQVTLVESKTVAAGTVKALDLPQSVSSFQAAYTVTVVTDEIISIAVSAPTPAGAVERANEVASQYLSFRASLLLGQQAQDVASLAQQIPAAQQHIAALQSQIAALLGQGAAQGQLTRVQNQLKAATDMLPTLEQTVTGLTVSDKSTTSTMIDGTQVLDSATLLHHSSVKDLVEYVLSGLIGGLAIGLGTVIVRELTSDRLRRRDDIAAALGAPVRLSVGRLSVGRLRKSRLFPGGRAAANRERDLRRIAAYLRHAAVRPGRGARTLAVVAVDNAAEIAPAVVALAEGCAKDSVRLVVADLAKGAPVARLLGAEGAGVHPVRVAGADMVVVIPEKDDPIPAGPLRLADDGLGAVPPAEAVVAAASQADLLLTVAELDPAVGGDHLGTWAGTAVAVFTAGRTRAARAYAVGEMLRLSGVHAISGVVVDADTTDESLGAPPARDAAARDIAARDGARPPEAAAPNGGQLR